MPHKLTLEQIWLGALLLLAVLVWVVCIFLLILVTRQLLDMLAYIMDLAQMS
jgi:hypothetical protein